MFWVHCKWSDNDGNRYQIPEDGEIMGPETFVKSMPVQVDNILERRLPYTIEVCYRDGFLVDGSARNSSVAAILSTFPGASYDWRGPIYGVVKQGSDLDPLMCRDMDMADFRYMADYFISYGLPQAKVKNGVRGQDQVVKGVMINCVGDRTILGKPQFQAIDVAVSDPIFDSRHELRDTSDIADRVEMPIFSRKCPPDLRWVSRDSKDCNGQSPEVNQEATFLHLCCDPKASFWVGRAFAGKTMSEAPWWSDRTDSLYCLFMLRLSASTADTMSDLSSLTR